MVDLVEMGGILQEIDSRKQLEQLFREQGYDLERGGTSTELARISERYDFERTTVYYIGDGEYESRMELEEEVEIIGSGPGDIHGDLEEMYDEVVYSIRELDIKPGERSPMGKF